MLFYANAFNAQYFKSVFVAINNKKKYNIKINIEIKIKQQSIRK